MITIIIYIGIYIISVPFCYYLMLKEWMYRFDKINDTAREACASICFVPFVNIFGIVFSFLELCSYKEYREKNILARFLCLIFFIPYKIYKFFAKFLKYVEPKNIKIEEDKK